MDMKMGQEMFMKKVLKLMLARKEAWSFQHHRRHKIGKGILRHKGFKKTKWKKLGFKY